MKRTILIYGAAMSILILLLRLIEYRFLIKQLTIEVYIGIVALFFTAVGIGVGLMILRRNDDKSANRTLPFSDPENNKKVNNPDLSDREIEVLQLMAEGLSNQEIADRLFISIHTVKTHTSNLFSKLQVRRRTQAVLKSRQIGLIT